MDHDKLPFSDFVEAGEALDPGTQERINHTMCTAGEDTRRRLYVKKVEDGNMIVAYCHNCGLKGYYIVGYTNIISLRGKATTPIVTSHTSKTISLPNGSSHAPGLWPEEAVEMLRRYGLSRDTAAEYFISYLPSKRRLVLPLYNRIDGTLMAYQLRKVFDDDPYPKYLSFISEKNNGLMMPCPLGIKSVPKLDQLVIVEDMLSAIKVMDVRPESGTVCLLGASLGRYETFQRFPDAEVLVWLDNDSALIKGRAKQIAESLQLFGVKRVHTELRSSEPKHMNSVKLANVLEHYATKGLTK